ncbi:MAG: response regulator transcription factor [Verrucomicrobiales bacterium]|nr:response regulator transcription factor [Verrucomicrobiales bacterium]
MSSDSPSKIVVIDDHPVMRVGLTHLINAEPTLEVVGEAGSASEGIRLVESIENLDLAIVDVSLPDRNGLEVIKDFRSMLPDLKCLVISSHDEKIYAERVLRAGGRGYVMKDRAPEQLVQAICKVLGGGIFLSQKMTARMMEILVNGPSGSSVESLTDRELEVYRAIGEGRTSREIAGDLGISIRTVDAHRTHIKEKLKFRDAAELSYNAIRWVESQA